jgi:hypothetical protein
METIKISNERLHPLYAQTVGLCVCFQTNHTGMCLVLLLCRRIFCGRDWWCGQRKVPKRGKLTRFGLSFNRLDEEGEEEEEQKENRRKRKQKPM